MAKTRACKRLKRSSSPAEEMIELKLVVDDENKRVLYAEAGVEFVDFLFSIMCLPLAFFAGFDECRLAVGKLYESLTKMDDSFFQASRWRKDELLQPALPSTFAGVKPGWPCEVKTRRPVGRRPALKEKRSGGGGGGLIYMITNDLEVMPMSTASILALVKSLGVGISNVNERMVTVAQDEKMGIMMALFSSKSVFTEIFLSPKKHNHAKPVLSPELTICPSSVQRRQLKDRTPANSRRRPAAGAKINEQGTGRNTRGAKLRSSANCESSSKSGRRSRGRGRNRSNGGRKVLACSSSSASSNGGHGNGKDGDGETQGGCHVKTERESSG